MNLIIMKQGPSCAVADLFENICSISQLRIFLHQNYVNMLPLKVPDGVDSVKKVFSPSLFNCEHPRTWAQTLPVSSNLRGAEKFFYPCEFPPPGIVLYASNEGLDPRWASPHQSPVHIPPLHANWHPLQSKSCRFFRFKFPTISSATLNSPHYSFTPST